MSKVKSKDKHQLILAAAEQIMLEEGMGQLSMNKVARTAQMAKGTLYLYFDSKEAILGELTIKARTKLLQQFKAAAQQHPDNALSQIEAICWACLDFFHTEQLYADLVSFYEANMGLKETPELEQSSLMISGFVIDIIKDGQQKGLIRNNIPAASLSFTMWGTNVGMMHLLKSKSHHIEEYTQQDSSHVFQAFIQLFIDGIKCKK